MTMSGWPSTSGRAGKVTERPAPARRSTPSSPLTRRGVMTEHRHELLHGPALRQLRFFPAGDARRGSIGRFIWKDPLGAGTRMSPLA